MGQQSRGPLPCPLEDGSRNLYTINTALCVMNVVSEHNVRQNLVLCW